MKRNGIGGDGKKGRFTGIVISTHLPFKEGHPWFTTVPFKPLDAAFYTAINRYKQRVLYPRGKGLKGFVVNWWCPSVDERFLDIAPIDIAPKF